MSLDKHLVELFGLQGRRISKLVITLEAGKLTTLQVTEFAVHTPLAARSVPPFMKSATYILTEVSDGTDKIAGVKEVEEDQG
jgi:hypothetical protein